MAIDLTKNGTNLRETFNPDDPVESLYMRLNECVDYETAADNTVTEGQVMRIAYIIVAETGQFQEDFQNRRAKSDPETTWTIFLAHFIKA